MRAALAVAVVMMAALPASANTGSGVVERPKKDRERVGKQRRARAPSVAVGQKPQKLVNVYNQWTREWLAIAPGEAVAPATRDRFLRDHYTNEPLAMEPKLLEMVLAAAQQFRSDTAIIVSAFRHPKYNLILRKKGHQVARDSNHTKGNAIDFQIPTVGVMQLHAWAKQQRLGGVGLYPASKFVHMDTGPIRYWTGD